MKKKGITYISVLLSALLIVMPFFRIKTYAEGPGEHDDIGYVASVEFFKPYGFISRSDAYKLSCVDGTSNPSTGVGYCSVYNIYDNTTYSDLNFFNIMTVNYVDSVSQLSIPSAYTTSNRFRTTKEPLYLVFLSTTNITSSNINVYPQSGYTVTGERVTTDNQTVMTPNGYYLITLKFVATSYPSSGTVWTTLSMPLTNNTGIIPIYKGSEASMSEDVHRIVFGTGQTYTVSDPDVVNAISNQTLTLSGQLISINGNQQSMIDQLINIRNGSRDTAANTLNIYNLLNQGNNGTQQSANDLNNTIDNANSVIDGYASNEQSIMTDFDDALQGINLNDSLIKDNKFLSSANWVRTQFNNMTSGNPFGSMIYFSLSIGIALAIIGKLRA